MRLPGPQVDLRYCLRQPATCHHPLRQPRPLAPANKTPPDWHPGRFLLGSG
jgi:hypothetical protein